MENKNKNKKIAIYIAVLIALLGGSFIIYKIASASINNAVISDITMTSIETGTLFDQEDGLVTNCDSDGKNCTSTYTASKDSSKDNILVKSFDKIKYYFKINVKDSEDLNADVEDVKVNLRVILNGDDNKYVTLDETYCNSEGLCVIDNVSSFESTYYSLTLNVNNAPNGYEIHPTFTFDVEENVADTAVLLGYNEASDTGYYYSYNDGTYDSTGPANYMPTIVSSVNAIKTFEISQGNTTQASVYDGKDGRFATYLVGIKLNEPIAGSYYDLDDISFKVSFDQDNGEEPIVNDNWIRLYGTEIVDEIRPVNGNMPFSTSSIGDRNKFIRNPGNITVTKDSADYLVTISNYELLLDRPTINSDGTPVSGTYVGTIALTNFSPRLESDGLNVINNRMTLKDNNGTTIATGVIQNQASSIGSDQGGSQTLAEADVVTSSDFYDITDGKKLSIKNGGSGVVSKGTELEYATRFKNNKTSSNQGVKEIIKFDTYAYRVIPYDDNNEIKIEIKCGKNECQNISSDDFEIKYVTGTFDYALGDKVQYELNDFSNSKLSDTDKAIAAACANYDLSSLNKDEIQNLYGGPCIKATEGVENYYNNIRDAADTDNNEIPISKIIVQTKEGIVLPDEAELIVKVKTNVRRVSDITRTYQATTMISTSDYDEKLYYFAPQINDAIFSGNYNKMTGGIIGDSLGIANFTVRQSITVTNTNSDGSTKTKYRTSENETITYKVETRLNDNEINVGADDTWYIRSIRVVVNLPEGLVYIPDDDLIQPIEVGDGYLVYDLVTPSDKVKANMKITDIYFKAKLSPTLSGKAKELTVYSYPNAININGEQDNTVIGKNGKFSIYGTGISEVVGTESIGESGSLIEKNGIINYVLNAYNNVGEEVDDYTLIDILPYVGDENGSNFTGSYSININSTEVNINNIKCTTEVPSKINKDNESIWDTCQNITGDFIEGITAIKIENISIPANSYMGNIIVSLKTKDNKAGDKYNNRFSGSTETSSDNYSNVIEASVISRTISGHAFLDNTGNSVKDGNETYVKDIPITLYKVDSEGILKNVADTVTDENGYYEFNNLEKGRYKIRAKYDITKYDLALRYATEDAMKDSDAYLIDTNGTVELSDKSETSKGLVLYPPVNSITNMDIGLLPKHTFGFTMNKYITRIDLTNNGALTTTNYDNLSQVSISVLNPKRYTAKVYYGISITNNSNKSGYVNLVKEDIPNGFIFDKNYPENAGWFELDGMIGNRSLENTLINPNETVYLQIVLFLPERDEAGAFVNTASIAEITEQNPIVNNINANDYVNNDQYVVGDTLRYAGINFHVIGAAPNGNEQILTLLADSGTVGSQMSHMSSGVYKWSNSYINNYLNEQFVYEHNMNSTALIPFNICDDASGLFDDNANGGIPDAQVCLGNIYTTSKVRLLTQAEFNNLKNNLSDVSFLNGNFWLMDAVYTSQNDNTFDIYGNVTPSYDSSNLVKYANNSTILPVQGNSGYNKDVTMSSNLEVRPVIRISTHDIILE